MFKHVIIAIAFMAAVSSAQQDVGRHELLKDKDSTKDGPPPSKQSQKNFDPPITALPISMDVQATILPSSLNIHSPNEDLDSEMFGKTGVVKKFGAFTMTQDLGQYCSKVSKR